MPELAALQRDFAAALRAKQALPAGLVAPDQAGRFAIYLNNVHYGLAQSLAEAYPVVRRLVGDEFFFAVAALHVQQALPRAHSLTLYGADFPRFLHRFPPARGVLYLADIARLERAALEALHAADTPIASQRDLFALGPALSEAPLALAASVRLIRSPHPIVAIHAANRTDHRAEAEGPRQIEARAQAALIYRQDDRVHIAALMPADAIFLRRLKAGWSIDRIAAHCPAAHRADGIVSRFQRLSLLPIFARPAPEET
ncbi:HvfC/BufC N-terminal domain-containing protein [Oceanibaculum pacificum]|uniref:Putative DNA-binding domain-containing protein n=1 Tax=Oceanibaculum pacificum TaxID=580166 RepID=A0A154W2K7_9PROT|nr:DNA-binding domain-containing protein [Oceanibaculum pacificum]KZD07862.1 hypothetical protein AUP43_09580 [Oceanibaculum pacificum]